MDIINRHGVMVRCVAGVAAVVAYAPFSASHAFTALLVVSLVSTPPGFALWLSVVSVVNVFMVMAVPRVGIYLVIAAAAAGALVLARSRKASSSIESDLSEPLWTRWRRPVAFAAAVVSLGCMTLKSLPLSESLGWAVTLFLIWASLPRGARIRPKVAVANLSLLMAGVFFAVLVLELGARAVIEPIVPASPIYVPHPKYNYTLGRDIRTHQRVTLTEGEPFEADVVVSSQGIYAREIFGPKADDEFRIIMLGDSFTAGHGLAWQDTLGQALQTLLADEPLKKRCVVINCGVGAYGPWQQRGFLNERGFPLEPDLVIHQLFAANDVHDTLLQYGRRTEAYPIWWHRRVDAFKQKSMPRYRAHDALLRLSRVYQLLDRHLPGATIPWMLNRFRYLSIIETRRYPPSNPRNWSLEVNLETWYPTLREGWDLFEEDVLAVQRDCEARNVDYIAYNIPIYVSLREDAWKLNLPQLGPGENYVKLKDVTETEAFLGREGVPYVDVTSALARQEDQSAMFHHPDGHLKKGGAWIVVGQIRDYLMTEYFPSIGLVRDPEPSSGSHD